MNHHKITHIKSFHMPMSIYIAFVFKHKQIQQVTDIDLLKRHITL